MGRLGLHVQLCSRFGVLFERLLRLFIDQRRTQQRLEVGRKVQAVTEDGEKDRVATGVEQAGQASIERKAQQ